MSYRTAATTIAVRYAVVGPLSKSQARPTSARRLPDDPHTKRASLFSSAFMLGRGCLGAEAAQMADVAPDSAFRAEDPERVRAEMSDAFARARDILGHTETLLLATAFLDPDRAHVPDVAPPGAAPPGSTTPS
jgi:uncharacterized protein YcbK (DUF882 family)